MIRLKAKAYFGLRLGQVRNLSVRLSKSVTRKLPNRANLLFVFVILSIALITKPGGAEFWAGSGGDGPSFALITKPGGAECFQGEPSDN